MTAQNAPHFIRALVEQDLAAGRLAGRQWAGFPSDARQSASCPRDDPAALRTRFPPEPNGYLHIGHAKSICLNFGLARDYGGRCHMRFDDTNPVKEDQEYVDAILDTVRWLGYDWKDTQEDNLYHASDYFEAFYACAEYLIEAGHAYVDELPPQELRRRRGTLTQPGEDSPYRARPAGESLARFRAMRAGAHPEGSMVLRARIDMASPNLNLRDPTLYRIRFAEHHRTANRWCIYPMYDYAHPISDALENITHSLCTLEFEDHRPFYDWLLERLAEGGFLRRPLPQQTEFARLNLYYTVTSKRKLQELVSSARVRGWDDPRMPTLVGLRRRGYTPESIQRFCERIGVSKAAQWVDPSVLDGALRDDLESRAPRACAVIDPVDLLIENWPEGAREACEAPWHPQHPEWGRRRMHCSQKLWIERDDVRSAASKGFFRVFPGNRVRLRYAFVIECTGVDLDEAGAVVRVRARYFHDSRSGTPGADVYKVKGNIHWVSQDEAIGATVHLYDSLFTHPQ
ncbi:MAG: glutamine--tRNA ligase, partial [Betaproteobacteria bacterium]|nr:glutamine--tRNA ligase [Betaproteobacteria bacterium]